MLLAASSGPLLFGELFGVPSSEPRLAGTADRLLQSGQWATRLGNRE